MATVSNSKVLGAITTMPLSATSIAKKLGFKKGAQIQKNLEELLESGDIQVDDSGRYPVYTKKSGSVAKRAKSAPAVKSSAPAGGECSVISRDGSESFIQFDETVRKALTNYKIEKPAVNKAGQTGTRVEIPSGKKIFVRDGMTLVIINDKPSYIVDSPVRLVEACHNFARDNGISAYKITQLGVGQINGEANVKMADIVCMKIDKIDKGASK